MREPAFQPPSTSSATRPPPCGTLPRLVAATSWSAWAPRVCRWQCWQPPHHATCWGRSNRRLSSQGAAGPSCLSTAGTAACMSAWLHAVWCKGCMWPQLATRHPPHGGRQEDPEAIPRTRVQQRQTRRPALQLHPTRGWQNQQRVAAMQQLGEVKQQPRDHQQH